jgi:ABC-type antimicrobial peptide transport system permease subunit
MTLRVRLKSGATQSDRETVMNGLRNFVDDDLTQVIDTVSLVDSTKVALDLLTLFFNLGKIQRESLCLIFGILVAVIAVILCFFVLWLSFTANVRENAWEFGVLRAVGLNVNRVIRMYIYEALCLITASVIIGAVVGEIIINP